MPDAKTRLSQRIQLRIPHDCDALDATGAQWLSIDDQLLFTLARLPPLHRDPFDRLLVAQALTELMRLVTRDRLVAQYRDTVIPA